MVASRLAATGRPGGRSSTFFTDQDMSIDPEQDPIVVGQDPAGSDAEQLAAELALARTQLAEARDAQLRAVAEMDNVRKRAQRDLEAAHRFAVERFASEMIVVRDTLELGIAHAGPSADSVTLVEGMQATLRMIDKAFEKAGISTVDPVGERFNPEFHEAMATQPSADQAPGTVLAVVQKGFVLNGRLLRPARVVIAKASEQAN
jgi:molecular chaperone GrpE